MAQNPTGFPNLDGNTTERDWRESIDTDGDGIPNEVDLDASKPPIKYRTIGTTWILDTNKPMNAIMEFLNGKITKRYAVVAKDI